VCIKNKDLKKDLFYIIRYISVLKNIFRSARARACVCVCVCEYKESIIYNLYYS